MEIQNTTITQEQKRDNWSALLDLIPSNTLKGTKLREAIQRRQNTEEARKTYKAKLLLSKQLEETKANMPQRVLGLMNDLAVALDDDDNDTLQDKMFNPDNSDSLMEVVADLLFIANHTAIVKPSKNMGIYKQRLSRAQILARATDPNDKMYGFCNRCDRPMAVSQIAHHQANTSICVEVRAGRQKTLELGRRTDKGGAIGRHIAVAEFNSADSSDSDEGEDVD